MADIPSGSMNPNAKNPDGTTASPNADLWERHRQLQAEYDRLAAKEREPVNTDPTPWNTLHDMLDMLLEGDTEAAMRASAKLSASEIKRFADVTDELRTILTARIAVRFMERMPEVKGLLKEYMPHLLDGEKREAGE